MCHTAKNNVFQAFTTNGYKKSKTPRCLLNCEQVLLVLVVQGKTTLEFPFKIYFAINGGAALAIDIAA